MKEIEYFPLFVSILAETKSIFIEVISICNKVDSYTFPINIKVFQALS